MSFSMSQVQKKTTTNQNDIRKCYGVIKSNTLITQNIKYGLEQYLNFRLRMRRVSKFYADTFKQMIDELLQNCCDKYIDNLTKQDVCNNEKEILYQIKKAIYYGSTKHIYYEFEDNVIIEDTSKLRHNVLPPRRINPEEVLDTQHVKAYFEEFVI